MYRVEFNLRVKNKYSYPSISWLYLKLCINIDYYLDYISVYDTYTYDSQAHNLNQKSTFYSTMFWKNQ